jgi:hypothetical protein
MVMVEPRGIGVALFTLRTVGRSDPLTTAITGMPDSSAQRSDAEAEGRLQRTTMTTENPTSFGQAPLEGGHTHLIVRQYRTGPVRVKGGGRALQ